MGLDVYLFQFEGVDTDAILKLWQFSEDFSSTDYKGKMAAKARELGLSEKISEHSASGFGGKKISFPSTRHPKLAVGEWYSFGTVRELMQYFLGKNFYFVLPEAEGIHGLFRPDWAGARKRLANILSELQNLTRQQIEDFHKRIFLAEIDPVFLEKLKALPMATPTEIFEGCLAQIEVMVETLDFVLNSGNPREFLLYWSE